MPSAVGPSEGQVPSSPNPNARRASTKVLSRNIDNVFLGDVQFDTWYYSPYPDSLITNLPDGHTTVGRPHHTRRDSPTSITTSGQAAVANGVVKSDTPKPSCSTLHVCPYCFRYTPNLNDYSVHFHLHLDAARQAKSKGLDFIPVPESATKVYDREGYAVWDVDGEVEKLYCQNLSLFGKLFLEQKSVFFDTSGFHYFVLTYTSPEEEQGSHNPSTSRKRTSDGTSTRTRNPRSNSSTTHSQDVNGAATKPQLPTQVMGFFSKENLSWDNNNLACILVFPPYQHRNLGQLLMTVSYKLSGWEWEDSIIGGPEKPLSAMGRKSYLRFWAERIARFVMGQSWDADGRVVFDEATGQGENEEGEDGPKTKGRKLKRAMAGDSGGGAVRKEEMTVREIGERTGMLVEDVVTALNEMGVCEIVSPKRRKKQHHHHHHQQQQQHHQPVVDASASDGGRLDSATEMEHAMSMTISRKKVVDWVVNKKIDLICPVKEAGFLGEWALSDMDSADLSRSSQDSVEDE